MAKVKAAPKKVDGATDNKRVNLSEYTGYYSNQPWWSEEYNGMWGDKQVTLNLPLLSPGEAMTMYKHIEGDT